ncbi:MAG: glycosyltransferase family 39 protein [Chloroflexota bacterium]
MRAFASFLSVVVILGGLILARPTHVSPFNPWFLVLFAGAAAVFVFARFYRWPVHRSRFLLRQPLSLPSTWGWIAAGLIFSSMAVGAMLWFEKNNYVSYLSVIIIWLTGTACCLSAFLGSICLPASWRSWFKAHAGAWLGVGGVMLLAFLLRFYELGNTPRVINGDEGWVGMTALATVHHPYANPFALWENFGTIYLQIMNALFNMLGATPFSLRLLPAIGGVMAIPATYLLGRQVANHRIGLLAAALLAVLHSHIHFSRTVAVMYIQDTWLIPLELYLLLSGVQKRRPWRVALAGIVLGFHFHVYLTAQLMTGVIFIYWLLLLLTQRGQRKPILKLSLVFSVSLATVILPHMVYALQHRGAYLERLSKEGTFNSGWLASEVIIRGESPVRILSERVLHVFLSLFHYPASDFYGTPMPMLALFVATLLILGLGIALWKTRALGYLLLNGYFWGVIVSVGILAVPPSADTYRILAAFPAVTILAATALDHLLGTLGLGWEQNRKGFVGASGLFLAGVALLNLWIYFFDFAGHCRYADDISGRFASYLGNYLRTLPREQKVYILSDDIFVLGAYRSVDFLSGSKPVIDFPDPISQLALVPGEMVIANPNRIQELWDWVHEHPGGELHMEYDCRQEILLSYRLPFSEGWQILPSDRDSLDAQP